jgi:site-specific DNA-methyltransferase (adenine-specific)/adenine-specific DNA-methyltransferase
MNHLVKKFKGKIYLIYIDPPFDSKADYKVEEGKKRYGE